jgi:hypothetical protein
LFPQITNLLVYKKEETANNMHSIPEIKLAENIDTMKSISDALDKSPCHQRIHY